MIRVLGLALYGPLAASNRYRLGQYRDGLREYGIDLRINHLLNDDYVRWRFTGGTMPLKSLFKSLGERLSTVLDSAGYDVAMLYCELLPLMPAIVEQRLIRRPYIYDLDDAFYLKYKIGRLRMARPFLGGKFDRLMRNAAAVTAGNKILQHYAGRHNPAAYYFPTVVDTSRYVPRVHADGDGVFTIGWIGSPSTAAYLEHLADPLSVISSEGEVRLVVIGAKAPHIAGVDVVELEWREESEIARINTFDVGVMPLVDDEWSRGKCAFKLIQYMACGKPVIASAVGANNDVVTGDCGFLASSSQEWVDALRLLRDNRAMAAEMGRAAREHVVTHYSLQHNLPVLAELITKTAGN
jgi:glycosyltransferase involved in cell wall biosynthesis